MTRTDHVDGEHRTRDGPETAAIDLADGGLLVYEVDNPEAWIEASDPIDPGEVQGP